jgi:hypothetical protein
MGIVWIAILTMVVAGVGLYLGFHNPARPGAAGRPFPSNPIRGPSFTRCAPCAAIPTACDWNGARSPGALGYSVTLMSATDESLL